jgi:hypothetical protein
MSAFSAQTATKQAMEEGTIRTRLLSPSGHVAIDELADAWFETDIEFVVAGASHAIGDPAFTGRIRGAFGAALVAAASPEAVAGKPCPWSPPCAFEALFRKQGRMEPGLEFPGPWVVEVDAQGTNLKVVLRLFGFAADYAGPAAEAMSDALANRLNYAGSVNAFFPKPRILSRRIVGRNGPVALPRSDELILDFLSPVLLSGVDIGYHPASLIPTLAARLAGLALWHDLALKVDREMVSALGRQLDFLWLSVNRLQWTRVSSRQGSMVIPMSGLTGRLAISGSEEDVESAARLLAFAVTCHIGADTAYGCGRFEIAS